MISARNSTAEQRVNAGCTAILMSSFSSWKPVIVPALVLIVCAAISSAALSVSSAASNTETPAWSTPANFMLAAAGYGLVVLVVVMAIVTIRRETRRSRELGEALQEHKDLIQIFTDGVENSAIFMLDAGGRIRNWNTGAERLHGYKTPEIIGKPYAFLYPKDAIQAEKADTGIKMAGAEGRHESVGWLVRKDGSTFHAHSVIRSLKGPQGDHRGFSVVTRDMTDMKQAEELLKKLSLSVEQSADLVLIIDRNGKVEYVNKAVEDVTGYTCQDFMSRGMELLQSGHHSPKAYREMWNTVLTGCSFQAEMAIRKKTGEEVILDEIVTPITDARGNVTHALFTASDITPVKIMKEKLSYLTSYDELTGLPNRSLFAERLNRDRTRASKGNGTMAILAMDIDRFKYINEIYGIEAGNMVLKQVAESLSVSVSKSDTVCRLGSDEFGIILHDIQKPSDIILFVKMIMRNVPQIIMSGGEEISVTMAVGISMYPDDGKDAHTLMKNADIALSKAKAQGRNNYQFYTQEMNVGVTELVFMERRLAEALQNKEYILNYQPYCYLSSGRVAGTEALLKWKNEEFGLVSPVKFIPMLEETGMIIDVGKWVLRTACAQLKLWDAGEASRPMSVNLSGTQFRHEFLAETVESTVKEFSIDPRHLTLEITESIFVKDQEFSIKVLKRLKDIGVAIAIDDFGTGYSSLSYLKRFPVDYVKIDQSFVQDVATDPDATSLVTAIINMAHSLNLKTIAEGVETEDQWKILRLLKCDMAQGYYFSAALPPKDVEKLLQ
jgi:diguanylate cyclase (GGDEF)-like protein/PAS domain S-box-containing protein